MVSQKHFIKWVEDFVCEVCGIQVKGNGYTDHCSACLWSKHVDRDLPGDRLSGCGGLMEPVAIRKKRDKLQIEYQCLVCAKIFWCRVAEDDTSERLVEMTALPNWSFEKFGETWNKKT